MYGKINEYKEENLVITMTVIYLTLVSLSWALYCLIIRFIDDHNQDVIVGLLSWSSTIFATIALLYTVNNWKRQKKAEVLSQISYDCSVRLVELQQDFDSLLSNCLDVLNKYKNNGLRHDFNKFYRSYNLMHTCLLRILSGRNNEVINNELLNMIRLLGANKNLLNMIVDENEELFLNLNREAVICTLSQVSSEFYSICNKIRIELDNHMYKYD